MLRITVGLWKKPPFELPVDAVWIENKFREGFRGDFWERKLLDQFVSVKRWKEQSPWRWDLFFILINPGDYIRRIKHLWDITWLQESIFLVTSWNQTLDHDLSPNTPLPPGWSCSFNASHTLKKTVDNKKNAHCCISILLGTTKH